MLLRSRNLHTRHVIGAALLGLLFAGLPGCAVMTTMQRAKNESLKALKPNYNDYENPAEQTSDPWIRQAAIEARGDKPTEVAYDPLGLRNILMSKKAREIERNMGFE